MCKKIFTNFFFQLTGGYLVTYVKLTCQTKIHGGQEKIEGARIRVRAGADACTFAYPSAVVRRWEQVVSRHMGSCANGNKSRVHASWSRADGSKNSKNFGRPYLPQNLSKPSV